MISEVEKQNCLLFEIPEFWKIKSQYMYQVSPLQLKKKKDLKAKFGTCI